MTEERMIKQLKGKDLFSSKEWRKWKEKKVPRKVSQTLSDRCFDQRGASLVN